jgi:hypothetical protein
MSSSSVSILKDAQQSDKRPTTCSNLAAAAAAGKGRQVFNNLRDSVQSKQLHWWSAAAAVSVLSSGGNIQQP